MAADRIVIKIKFIDEKIGDKVDARMESGDNQQHIRVRGRGGIVVLDAGRQSLGRLEHPVSYW